LALDHKPLNLGQGFPDFAAPDYVTKALAEVATGENVLLNQYTRGFVSSVCTVLWHLQPFEDSVHF
jgi:aspartate/methionine/tyrosine aminotransferase